MKIYLYYIRTLPRMDEYQDRKLICSTSSLKETKESLTLEITEDDKSALNKLVPGRNYGLLIEVDGERQDMKYYNLKAYELSKAENPKINLTLYMASI